MADAPEGAPPAEEGAKQVAKRRKPKKEAPEATKFVEADVVETVLTLPADKLRIDEDKTHGQVHLRPGWGPPLPQAPSSVVSSGWVPRRNTSSPPPPTLSSWVFPGTCAGRRRCASKGDATPLLSLAGRVIDSEAHVRLPSCGANTAQCSPLPAHRCGSSTPRTWSSCGRSSS